MKCQAKSKQTGEQCKRQATPGHKVCASHGSKSKQARAAAERRIEQAKAESWLLANIDDALPLASIDDVYDELLAVAGQASAWRKVLASRVAALEQLGYEGVTGEQVRADVALFERSMDRAMKAGELIVRLDIEGKRQRSIERLAEQHGHVLAEVIRRILTQLNLSPEQQTLVGTVVPAELRAIQEAK